MGKNVKMAAPKEEKAEMQPLKRWQRRRVKYLTKDEVEAFFGAIPREQIRDRLLFHLIYQYGLRRSEVGLIDRYEHLASDRIWIVRAKGGVANEYPLSRTTRRLLWCYLSTVAANPNPRLFPSRQSGTEGISGALVYYLFRKYAKAAGLPPDKQHPHVLRHSIGTHLLNGAGWELLEVSEWLGHTSIDSTTIYVTILSENRARAYRQAIANRQIARI